MVEEGVEKGFEFVELEMLVENGLVEVEVDNETPPNKAWPRAALEITGDCSISLVFVSFPLIFEGESEIITPRKARTLPSLRLHVFRRHVNTYSRL